MLLPWALREEGPCKCGIFLGWTVAEAALADMEKGSICAAVFAIYCSILLFIAATRRICRAAG